MPSSDTQWKRGQSGNPNGRPKGLRTNIKQKEKLLIALLNAVEKDWLTIVGEQIKLAVQGDHNAAKLMFEYVLPKQKAYFLEREEDDELDLDGLDTIEKREQARAIILDAQLKITELCETTH